MTARGARTTDEHSAEMRQWYERRMAKARDLLGGKCERCGAKDSLEFDHVDPNTKSFTITGAFSLAWSRIVKELKKCQLLCRPCHEQKTHGDAWAARKHGDLNMYCRFKCRCEICRTAWNAYSREVKRRSRARAAERSTAARRHPVKPHGMEGFCADETWQALPDDDRYETSTCGRIRSWVKRGGARRTEPHLLKAHLHQGIPIVTFHGAPRIVARLVASAFAGEVLDTTTHVRHADNDATNNHRFNLFLIRTKGATPCAA